jgi:hypothetical protein
MMCHVLQTSGNGSGYVALMMKHHNGKSSFNENQSCIAMLGLPIVFAQTVIYIIMSFLIC